MVRLGLLRARRPRLRGAVAAIALAVPVATGIAACGGGRHAPPRAGAQKPGAVRGRRGIPERRGELRRHFRWLIAIAGRQPSIAVENRHRGTNAWRLPGPAIYVGGLAHGAVAGYVSEPAVLPGQTERIYVSAPHARRVRIRMFRMGWYRGTGGREVLVSASLRVVRQPRCAHSFATGLTACGWHPTLTFVVPPALPTGVYIAKLSAGTGASDCLFVVRASRPQPLLAQLPTATYEAYNAWGGDSLYPGGSDRVKVTGTTQGVEVSSDRPYDSVTGAGQFFARDVAMIRFLERYRYPVSYTTSESVDGDPGQLAGHRALIDFGHSEYWSERQAHAFARARDQGTSLLFLGSDTLAWRVRYAPAPLGASDAGRPGHTIIAYKEHFALDPDRADPTGAFANLGAGLTGSAYLGCITPRVRQPGPPAYRYYAWTPSPSLHPRWLFQHTGITASTRIPGIVGYELDVPTPASPPLMRVLGSGLAPCMANEAAEPGAPFPGAAEFARTTLYTVHSGAVVFDTGTLGWELGLEPVPSASPDAPRAPDARLVAMTRNLLAYVLRSRQGR